MKKLLAVSMLLCLASAAFALDLSAGGCMTVGAFSSRNHYEEGLIPAYTDQLTTVPFSFSAFFDATYGIASIGFRANGNTHEVETMDFGGPVITNPDDDNRSSCFLSLSLFGRYPFDFGPVTLFPLLGFEYDLNVYYKDENGADLKASMTDHDKADLNQFWFKAGVGSDIVVYKGLSIRPLLLLGFKLLNSAEKTTLDTAKANAASASYIDFVFEGGVQVGWRF